MMIMMPLVRLGTEASPVDRIKTKIQAASLLTAYHVTSVTVSFATCTAGYRIGPFEVESALMRNPEVAEAAVVGLPDPEGLRGEIVAAFVVLREPTRSTVHRDEAARAKLVSSLQRMVKHDLSAHEYPRHVEFLDALPKTPSGKIQRFLLKQRRITPEQSTKA